MRLTAEQKRTIREPVDDFLGGGAELFVYGSRLNDEARGGDVDLLVRTAQPVDMLDQARLHARLEEALQLPVDLLFCGRRSRDDAFQTDDLRADATARGMRLSLLQESRGHLADLLEASQRCAWHLQAGSARMHWPLTGELLALARSRGARPPRPCSSAPSPMSLLTNTDPPGEAVAAATATREGACGPRDRQIHQLGRPS